MRVVVIDYFTKWVKAESLPKITSGKLLRFVINNITTIFGIPYKIISNNGTQFENKEFSQFCWKNGIVKRFLSVAHPKANGAVEAANKTIKTILKKRLNKSKGKWVEELSLILWACRAFTKATAGHISFSLTMGVRRCCQLKLRCLHIKGSLTHLTPIKN